MTTTPSPASRLRDQDDFDALILVAAEQANVQPLAVEKDYWVCEALRALTAKYPHNVVFKGGTSLEKLRIIQRFSENLDILVTGDLGNDKSTKAILKDMIAVAATVTGKDPVDSKSGGKKGAFHRRAYLEPELKNDSVGGIADAKAILVELGQAGGPQPSSNHQVTSLLADRLALNGQSLDEYADTAPFGVTVLHPGRTLIEKLFRVNNFANRPEAQADLHGWPRIGRQFYDVWALLGDSRVTDLLADEGETAAICANVIEISQAYTPDDPIPTGGFAASPAFDASHPLAVRLKREHDTAIRSLYYGDQSTAPTFQDVLDRVHQHVQLLDITLPTPV